MKRKKAALYDPYLDVMGGGERYILSILKVLEEYGYDPEAFWDTDLSSQIAEKLHIPFKKLTFKPNIFKTYNQWKKFQALHEYDILLYVTDGSYFFSGAHKTAIYCMVPDKKLYTMSLINSLKTRNSLFLTHSQYVQSWLKSWGIDSKLLYPYIDTDFLTIDLQQTIKEPIILSVGRFFKHLHSKRHDIAIKLFLELTQQNARYQQYKLVLAGGLKDEEKPYFDELKRLAGDNPNITLLPNISYPDLLALYKKSQFYWHCAGWEIDEQAHPESVEHLGISPLEAMAAGCITFCYNAGGPKELIHEGSTGYLFSNQQVLFQKMNQIMADKQLHQQIQIQSQQFVQDTFSYEVFAKHVTELFPTL